MYTLSNILLFIHLVAFAVGVATNVAMPLVMRQMAAAAPEAKAGYGAISRKLSMNGRVALGVLVLSGVALVWLRYGGVAGLDTWFWVKMILVAVIVLLMVALAVVDPGRINPRILGTLTRLLLLGIVFAAVFAFN
jgi:hypothetical protein